MGKIKEVDFSIDKQEKNISVEEQLEGKAKETMDELREQAQGNVEAKEEVETNTEDLVLDCLACNTQSKNPIPVNLLAFVSGEGTKANTSPISFFICPNCGVIQMPKQVLDEVKKRMGSRIITI